VAKWVQAVNEMGTGCNQLSVESWLVQPIKELSSAAGIVPLGLWIY